MSISNQPIANEAFQSYEAQELEAFLRNFLARLRQERCVYAALRNYEDLPRRIGHDLDLLVADLPQFEQTTRNAAEEMGWQLAKKVERKPFLTLIFNPRASDHLTIIKIDAWSSFTWKGIELIGPEVLKDRRLCKNLFYILQPGAEAAMSLVKGVMYHGKVLEKYKAIMPEMVQKDRASFCQALGPCFGTEIVKRLADLTAEADWSTIEVMTGSLRRIAAVRALRRHPLTQFRHWGGFLWGHLRKYFHPQGFMLVFIGPDGSGKSTISHRLAAYLNPMFGGVRYFHGHFQILPRLRDLVASVGFKIRGSASSLESSLAVESENKVNFGWWRSLVYISYYTLDYLLGHFLVFIARGKDQLVIFDRYYYDYLIQPGISLPPWLLFRLMQLVPQPDLIIYLKNTPEVILSRKPELTRGELVRQGQICTELIGRLRQAQTVETTQGPEETTDQVAKILCSNLVAREQKNEDLQQ